MDQSPGEDGCAESVDCLPRPRALGFARSHREAEALLRRDAQIAKSLELPWYKEWTGKEAKSIKDNIAHVYKELTGKIDYDKLGLNASNPTWFAAQ